MRQRITERRVPGERLAGPFVAWGAFLIMFLFWGNCKALVQCYPLDKIAKGTFRNSWKMSLIIVKVTLIIE